MKALIILGAIGIPVALFFIYLRPYYYITNGYKKYSIVIKDEYLGSFYAKNYNEACKKCIKLFKVPLQNTDYYVE